MEDSDSSLNTIVIPLIIGIAILAGCGVVFAVLLLVAGLVAL